MQDPEQSTPSEPDYETVAAASRILALAIGIGPLFFYVAIAFLFVSQEPPALEAEHAKLLAILSGAHGFLFLSSLSVGPVLEGLKGKAIREGLARLPDPRQGIESALEDLRGVMILRLALFEGAALMGGVVCFLGVSKGGLEEHPELWLNCISTLALLGYVLANLPSAERLRARVEELLP